MDPRVLARIERASGVGGLVDVLADALEPTDFSSLLLEVYRRRAERLSPARVAERFRGSRFVRPSEVRPCSLRRFDALAFDRARALGWEELELAPVTPLGTCSSMAAVHQNVVLSTARNEEVVSDPTNVLALECADRRRRGEGEQRLCTSHRVLRPQYQRGVNAWPHFRLFVLVHAGRAEGGMGFECRALLEQARWHLGLLESARAAGLEAEQVRCDFTALGGEPVRVALEQRVLAPLREEFPTAAVAFDDERTHGRAYYTTASFAVRAQSRAGEELLLGDGGCTDWMQQLLGDKKERYVISGFGSERYCAVCDPEGLIGGATT